MMIVNPLICLVDAPADSDHPGAVLDVLARASAMESEVWFERLGHRDFTEPAEAALRWLDNQTWVRKRRLVALVGEVSGLVDGPEGLPMVVEATDLGSSRVIAACGLNNSRNENPHLLGEVELAVDAQWRRRGVGSAMLAALRQVAGAWGATTIQGWASYAGLPDGEVLMPAEGPFGVPAGDGTTAFLQHHGFSLAQTERHSVQPLSKLGELAPVTTPQGYELVVWRDHMDPALAAGIADLTTAFEASIPMGELDNVPEVYTAERILAGDVTQHAHSQTVNVVARDVASGVLVARTQLGKYRHLHEAAWQGVTVVLPGHRGHGLGRTIKLAAMHEARAAWPRVARVHTWNAGENDRMWTINESLGYRTEGISAAWQKRL